MNYIQAVNRLNASHLIFAGVKMGENFRRKAHFVTGGHTTEVQPGVANNVGVGGIQRLRSDRIDQNRTSQ